MSQPEVQIQSHFTVKDYRDELEKALCAKYEKQKFILKLQEEIMTVEEKINGLEEELEKYDDAIYEEKNVLFIAKIELLNLNGASALSVKTSSISSDEVKSTASNAKKPSDKKVKPTRSEDKCKYFKTCHKFGCPHIHNDGWIPGKSKIDVMCNNEKGGKTCTFQHCVYRHTKK